MNFFDSPPVKCAMSKLLLAFIFYTVAAASFNGFFVKWNFLDVVKGSNLFFVEDMINGTAQRPYVYRRLIVKTAKEIKLHMSPESQERFIEKYSQNKFLTAHYAGVQIEKSYFIEYHAVYFISFAFLFLSMFLIRQIGIEVTGNSTAGTLTACAFTILFPLFDVRFYYDFGEIFFFSLATLLAIKGYWLALILIAPVAEYNKESFLFFLIMLFPLLSIKLDKKKSAFVIIFAVFVSGLVYLKLLSTFAQNPGETVYLQFGKHIEYFFHGWTKFDFNYGVWFGYGMFIPYLLFIAWIVKNSWNKLLTNWKHHIYLALTMNFPLYIMNCAPNELRNFSLTYIGFIALLSIFIKNLTAGKDF